METTSEKLLKRLDEAKKDEISVEDQCDPFVRVVKSKFGSKIKELNKEVLEEAKAFCKEKGIKFSEFKNCMSIYCEDTDHPLFVYLSSVFE